MCLPSRSKTDWLLSCLSHGQLLNWMNGSRDVLTYLITTLIFPGNSHSREANQSLIMKRYVLHMIYFCGCTLVPTQDFTYNSITATCPLSHAQRSNFTTCPGDLEFFVCCVTEDRLSETCLSGPLSLEVGFRGTGSVVSSLELARDAESRAPPQTYESESVF